MPLRRLAIAAFAAIALFGGAPAVGQNAAEQAQPRTVDIASHVAEASQRFGLPETWIYAVMRSESAGRIGAVSSAGAMGLMQLMPGTWARQRTRFGLGADPFNPRDNIIAGTSYLREMYDSYGASGFLAAYNAGPGRYEDWQNRGRPLPAETRAYVAKFASMLQSDSAPTIVASTSPMQPVRTSWAASQLFAVRTDAAEAVPGANIDEVTAAPPPASSRPLGGLFAPVSGSRPQ
ncbi:MAG: lytic transglycosylase domain-containing protein [Alphaproteobacteria bacterium]|nr:lytic transglycosylase domain-containing protein [Alphaproteobacteria bacterium]